MNMTGVAQTLVANRKEENITELDVLLKSLNIKHIYSYDDEWDLDKLKTEAEERYQELLRLDYTEFSKMFGINILKPEDIYISNNGIILVEEIVNSQSKELDRLKLMFEKHIIKERDSNPLNMLNAVLEKIAEKEEITVKRFPNKFSVGDVRDVDGRILFLLDMNMGDNSQDNDVVINTILEISKSRPNNHDIAVVYSHEKLEMYNQHDTKVRYVDAYLEKNKPELGIDNETIKHLLPFQLWAISKGEVDGRLLDLITTTLEKAAFGYSLHDYLKAKHNLTQKATLELIKLPEETFEVLYKDAFVEGEIFLDILERTHQSILNKVEYDLTKDNSSLIENLLTVSISKNKRISEEIKSLGIKKFRMENTKKKTDPVIFKGLSEYGLINYSINLNYSDIMTGDLFVFNTFNPDIKKYGILVTTDCDLPVRPKGNEIKESNRNAKAVTLLLCDSIAYSETNEEFKKAMEDEDVLWPIYHENQHLLLIPDTKSELLTTDSRILDLCSLNKDGSANLLINEDIIKNYKTYYFNDYYKNNLNIWMNKVFEISNYIPQEMVVKEGAVAATDSNQLISLMAGLKYSIKLNYEDKKFEVQRIGRLETRRTLQLIQTKVNHMSRIGLTSVPGA
ncbi:hypothetical protein [Paenibacillus sp. USDA918EY]|uniref:hypothetical protein n=1 Tax=Paenibacillus sp. USDA918EY TaxID=2689575 RepID=UPI001356CBA5|nr:hypothetical protein [Paenibacillus sp. USDA918EY]